MINHVSSAFYISNLFTLNVFFHKLKTDPGVMLLYHETYRAVQIYTLNSNSKIQNDHFS